MDSNPNQNVNDNDHEPIESQPLLVGQHQQQQHDETIVHRIRPLPLVQQTDRETSMNSTNDDNNNNNSSSRIDVNRIIDVDPHLLHPHNHHHQQHQHHHHHNNNIHTGGGTSGIMGRNRSPSLSSYGSVDSGSASPSFNRLRKKTWSFHGKSIPKESINNQNQNNNRMNENSNDRPMNQSKSMGTFTATTTTTTTTGLLDHITKIQQQGNGQTKQGSGWTTTTKTAGEATTLLPKTAPVSSSSPQTNTTTSRRNGVVNFLYYFVYAIVNNILSVPALYGYSAVIFSHECYQPHMNILAKLVLISSGVHQLCFCWFSTLPFAIGTVQDAGLIFLNTMATIIADTILTDDGNGKEGSPEAVISTALVLLSGSTASLGLILILLGYFRLADAVAYLPMPVVGGYLAFIGYFCLMAGVALCISKNMSTFNDWEYLLQPSLFMLALPGLLTGLLFTLISRYSSNDAILPIAMVTIPSLFYLLLYVTNTSFDDAREAGWVGEIAPSVPIQDFFTLIDFKLVRWDIIPDIFPTWVGMVFVVSFASCLDVAAISMDMGEALDTNKELTTVGIGNFFSGLTFGFTGSYIFSQTIFTYRTGVHSRWVGIFIVLMFGYVVISPINLLEVSPLFVLGSTLIFIGFELVYEWLVEIREKIFLSEYFIVWGTFIAIQIVGMDAGILIGVLFAIIDHVVHTASTTGVYRVIKQSRATWSPEENQILQDYVYYSPSPKIVALEVVGSVFFGSSLFILQRILDEIAIDTKSGIQTDDIDKHLVNSPRTTPSYFVSKKLLKINNHSQAKTKPERFPPSFVVLDLTRVTNLDASAARGCFLQLAKIAQKHSVTICACGASVRIEWMLRSHGVAYDQVEEETTKSMYFSNDPARRSDRLLHFHTSHEALEFCEQMLVNQLSHGTRSGNDAFFNGLLLEERRSLSDVFGRFLGSSPEDLNVLQQLNGGRYHTEQNMQAGSFVFLKGAKPDGFYVVLHGAMAVAIDNNDPRYIRSQSNRSIVSGAGLVQQKKTSSTYMQSNLMNDDEIVVSNVWPVGGILGYVDFLLERPRTFSAVATQDGTIVAKMTMAQLRLLQNENATLDACLQRILLKASLLDLGNCTCDAS